MCALNAGADGLPPGLPNDHGIPTLGPEILWWAEENLAQPDREVAGDPWRWTNTQARIMLWWYALDDQGRWLYHRGQIVMPKGAGKSPLAAAYACCSLVGPVLFDGWDSQGLPQGRPHPSPVVQCTAVSESQVKNTYSLVINMLRDGVVAKETSLDIGATRILTSNGILEPTTSSYISREGNRPTDAVLDETGFWFPGNHGVTLAATLRRNLGKTGGRSLETTNAWVPGEESVAEATWLAFEKAIELGHTPKILRYHPVALVKDLSNIAEVRRALEMLYSDSPWIDIERKVDEIYDLNTPPQNVRRFDFNQIVTAEDSLVAPWEWDACSTNDQLRDKDAITLGFDGGRTDDATALVALRVPDRYAQPLLIQEKPQGAAGENWEVDRDAFDGMVAFAFEHYQVLGFYGDLKEWETYIDKWSNEYRERLRVRASPRSAVGWDMRGRLQQLTQATERLVAAIQDGDVLHNGNAALRRHVLNARRRPNRWGVSFGKEHRESPKKVDGFAALQLADMARHDLLEGGYKPRDGRVIVWR